MLDQVVKGIYQTKRRYLSSHLVTDVEVVVLMPHRDYYNMLNDMRCYPIESKFNGTENECRIHGCRVLRKPDLEQGDIRFVVELPK
jgi:hypothetical protein